MELRDYLRVARRQWWVIAASMLVALGVAMLFTLRTKPVYAATVTFFVATAGTDGSSALEGSMFVQGRLKTYSTLLTGDRMAKALAANPDLGLSATEIQDRITVATSGDTVLIDVTVTDESSARALVVTDALVAQFQSLVRQLEVRPGEKTAVVQVSPLEPPRLSDDLVEPRPMHNDALGLAVGLILGTALAVVREISDTSVRSADVLRELTATPLLGRIPVDRARRKAGPFISDTRSPRAEALRKLRTNIQYADLEHPVKTLVVTSAVAGEGRSSTACGLAILFAEAGRRVLIVDAELRRPRLAAFLGHQESAAGLSTVLAGAASLDQALQPWGTGLWLLSSGHRPPNPSELLGSQRMADLLDEMRGRFDLVIFDSPPLLPVTDSAVIAARADGALLLVRSRKTTPAQVTGAVRALRAVDARMLGCVITMVAPKQPGRRRLFGRITAEPPLPAPQPRWWTASARPPLVLNPC